MNLKKYFIIGIFIVVWVFFLQVFLWDWQNNNFNLEQKFWQKIQKIITKKNGLITSSSTAYEWENFWITSHHSVNDDSEEIFAEKTGKKLYKIWWNPTDDIAILSENYTENWQEIYTNFIEENFAKNPEIGENVFAFVYRNENLQKLSGKIIAKNTEIIAIDKNGKPQKIIAKILTDIAFEQWDSGSIILTENGETIDVVHIAK